MSTDSIQTSASSSSVSASSAPENSDPALASPVASSQPLEAEQEVLDAAAPESAGEKLVPVTQAIRYRKRAQAAEQQLAELGTQLQQLRAQLEETRQASQQLERRQRINDLLTQADAVDLEAARLLTEAAVQMMSEPDVKLVIDDLRRTKPYLFRRRGPLASAMPAHADTDDSHPSEQAASQALASGHRRDLLRYLRLRRDRQEV